MDAPTAFKTVFTTILDYFLKPTKAEFTEMPLIHLDLFPFSLLAIMHLGI